MKVYEHKGYTFHWTECHKCKKGGNGSGECEAGGKECDGYLHRGCWSGIPIKAEKEEQCQNTETKK